MKPSLSYAIAAITSVVLLSSCYPTLYFPDRANTPGFREAKEAKLIVGVKMQSSDTANGDIATPVADAAYAITKHWGVAASYRSLNDKTLQERYIPRRNYNDTTLGGRYNSHYFDGSAGWFTTFGRVGQFEIYAGGGFGNIQRRGYTTPQNDFDCKYYKLFVQPALNITPGEGNIFRVGGGFRITMVDYYEYKAVSPDTKYLITQTTPRSRLRTDPTTVPYFYYEPFINLEVGYKFFKFNMQTGGSIPASGGGEQLGYGPFMSLGLVFHYAPRFFK